MTSVLTNMLMQQRVIVCVGSGGVGKTTTAAALALAAGALGRRAIVVTIDPAKRLANALGLATLPSRPVSLSPQLVATVGRAIAAEPTPATVMAMMLEPAAAWRDMLQRTAPNQDVAARIEDNRFYRVLSSELPGSQEFIACEQLLHLAEQQGPSAVDLIVLDTPPTQNALDFLDAPNRILSVLDADFFRVVTAGASRPAGVLSGLFGSAAERLRGVIAMFTGRAMLDEMADLLLTLRDLYDPLTDRTRRLLSLMSSDACRFVVVSAPQPSAIDEAGYFLRALRERQLPVGAVIANRYTESPTSALLEAEHLDDRVPAWSDRERLIASLDAAVTQQHKQAQWEEELLHHLAASASPLPLVSVPKLNGPIHDAEGMATMAAMLCRSTS
jgi:anion-transporting  ArsA/GET3 family ATPase